MPGSVSMRILLDTSCSPFSSLLQLPSIRLLGPRRPQIPSHEDGHLAACHVLICIIGEINPVQDKSHTAIELNSRNIGRLRLGDNAANPSTFGRAGDERIHESISYALSLVIRVNVKLVQYETGVPGLHSGESETNTAVAIV